MNTVHTSQGDVSLLAPPVELLRTIRSFLPFGLVRYHPAQEGADFGLVMQCGDQELSGTKQQPVDCDAQQSNDSYQANTILIAHSLAGYLTNGFSGLLLPCGYRRTKEGARFESGIAYFAYPSPQGRESREHPYDPAYDSRFGHGFTTMVTRFMVALQQSSRDTGITLFQPIGFDVRRRLQLGALGFGFMLVGRHVVCLKTVVSEQDFTWTALRASGISQVFHLPSLPAAIDESELETAKPGA